MNTKNIDSENREKRNPNGAFGCVILPIDDEVRQNVKKIVTEHPEMIAFSGKNGSSYGDTFLIAAAMKCGLTIITEENKDKQN